MGIRERKVGTKTLEEAMENLRLSGSHTRIPAILDLFGLVDIDEWYRLLGENWSSCDYVSLHGRALKARLGVVGPLRAMMTPEENAAYDALPNVVTIYRGCDGFRPIRGMSWSLDWDIANLFPFLQRYEAGFPMVRTATVKKNRILALKLGNGESEIITFSAKTLVVAPATDTAARADADQCKAPARKAGDDGKS